MTEHRKPDDHTRLVVHRYIGQGFYVGDAYVRICEMRKDANGHPEVKVMIEAPRETKLLREELLDRPPRTRDGIRLDAGRSP